MLSRKTLWAMLMLPPMLAEPVENPGYWATVEQLAAGTKIQIQTEAIRSITGTVDHVSVDAIYLFTNSQTVEIRQAQVKRVYVLKKRSWFRPVLIGAGIGTAAAGIAAPRVIEHGIGYGAAVAGTICLGAVIGAGLGFVCRGSGKQLIYVAK